MSTLFPKTYITQDHGEGGYIDGRWVDGAVTESTMVGSIQPLSGRELASLEIGRADLGKVKIYSSTELQVSNDGGDEKGTIVFYRNKKYEVIQEMAFDNNLISHFKYIAELRVERVPL
jgi:hypothetical protein